LRDPKENLVAKPPTRGIEKTYAVNSPETLAAHLKATGGRIRTRFPPEPNGHLHIGHAKAMNFDFGQAKLGGGECILRFDDTNPTAEKQEYIDSILDSVSWLGHTQAKTTYSSDYFDQLHDLAVQLIKKGGAYVCHQTGPEIKASRNLCKQAQSDRVKDPNAPLPQGAESPFRDRAMEENLQLFEEMSRGVWDEGTAFLRFKGNLKSDNPNMWDLAAYRIMFSEHPHSKDKYCIYPTYDFTHNIVDSLENITHSVCTLEFEGRQAAYGPYYWLLDELDLYKPVTWEFSRCNIEYNVLSKRRLNSLVTDNHVNGWDDPRLLTISGMKRRGYSADAVNKFVQEIGVTRAANWSKMELLEGIVRGELDDTAPRAFAIMDPIKVTISNHPGGENEIKEVPVHPKRPDGDKRQLPFTKVVYIDRSDWRDADEDKYFGMAPGKEVKLLFAYNIKCNEVKKDSNGIVTEVMCTYDAANTNKCKGNLSWLPDDAVPAEIRLYDRLFVCPQPGSGGAAPAEGADEDEDDTADSSSGKPQWLKDVNPDSLTVQSNALVEASVGVHAANIGQTFQFMRVGYFVIDQDSTASKLVLNRVVSLRESK